MWAGDVAGGADSPEQVAGGEPLAWLDTELALVAVPEHGAVIETDHGLVAEGAVAGGLRDDAGSDRPDLGALVGGEVEARVGAGPQPAGLRRSGRSGGTRSTGSTHCGGLALSSTPCHARASGSNVSGSGATAAAACGCGGQGGAEEQPGQERGRDGTACIESSWVASSSRRHDGGGQSPVARRASARLAARLRSCRGHTGGPSRGASTPGWILFCRCAAFCKQRAATSEPCTAPEVQTEC